MSRGRTKREEKSKKCAVWYRSKRSSERDGQNVQANRDRQDEQRQRESNGNSLELPREGENQQRAPRDKQENRLLPGTSRQANIWDDVHTPILAERL